MNNHKDNFFDLLCILLEKAMKDGVISKEEEAIISSVRIDLSEYKDLLEKSKKDGVITLTEAIQLEEFKNNILANASTIAVEDFVLSDDEKVLLRILSDTIIKHSD